MNTSRPMAYWAWVGHFFYNSRSLWKDFIAWNTEINPLKIQRKSMLVNIEENETPSVFRDSMKLT